MKTPFKTWVFAAFLAAIMIGCGGGGGGTNETAATTINGVASLGPISGGTVKVYALNADGSKGSQLGTTVTTGADGSYSVSIGTYTGNVIVEVSGGNYKDEATGSTLTNATLIRAALTGVSSDVSVAVTPLTEIAVKYAGGSLTTTKIEQANSLVGAIAGVNIITTLPANVVDQTASSNASVDQISYGLMLAAISQMVADGNATSPSDAITKITTDLSDGQLDTTGAVLTTAITTFVTVNPNNLSGVTTLEQTNLDNTISYITTSPITPPSNISDLTKAKALVGDLRNTALSIYNYQGVGTAGVFNGLAEELETKIKPELTYTVERIGWILEVASWKASGNYYNYDIGGINLSITFTSAANDLDYSSASFTVKDFQGNTIDTGSLTVQTNGDGRITSGSFTATMKTASGNLSANLNYTGTISNGLYTSMTFTGSMAAPGLSLDFSQSGRKLYATFAPEPGSADPTAIYPTSILASARITTTTAQMDGNLDISSIVWANKGYMDWQYQYACVGEPRPKTGTFTGSFEELKNGATTGVKFSGTITGGWDNVSTYDGCSGESSTNFAKWNASFDGKIEAPSRPIITAFLKATQSEFGKIALDANYRRTNTDGTIVYLSGSGTRTEVSYPWSDTYPVVTATLTNQDGLMVYITHTWDERKSEDERFSGTIKTSGGEKMADLYTIEGAPMIKYVDNYIESIF